MSNERPQSQYEQGSGGRQANPSVAFKHNEQEDTMNQDEIKGNFDQVKGKIKQTWSRLTDNEVALANGKRDQFFDILQEKYGLAREDAEEQLKKLEDVCARNERAA